MDDRRDVEGLKSLVRCENIVDEVDELSVPLVYWRPSDKAAEVRIR